MNEAETRAEHIDSALKATGRDVVEDCRVLREHGITLGRLHGGGGKGGHAKVGVGRATGVVPVYSGWENHTNRGKVREQL